MKTYFMDRLFSDPELQEKVTEKMKECKDCGSAELETEDMDLKFADAGDEVIVEDQTNDEVTALSDPDEDGNVQAEEITIEGDDTPEETVEVESDTEDEVEETEEEVKEESETQPDVKTEVVESEDGKHIEGSEPEVKVSIEAGSGINDPEKAGLKNFSLTFKGASPEYIAKVTKAFADVAPSIDADDKMSDQADEMLKVAVDGDKEFADDEIGDVHHNVNEISKAVDELEETKDPELAKEIKSLTQKVYAEAERLEKEKDADMDEVKEQCNTFSDAADKVLDEEANRDAYEAGKLSEEANEEEEEASKEECNKNFSACLQTEFDDMSVAPHKTFVMKEDKTFSNSKTEELTSNNPFLTSSFD